jgi:hypothetical protein
VSQSGPGRVGLDDEYVLCRLDIESEYSGAARGFADGGDWARGSAGGSYLVRRSLHEHSKGSEADKQRLRLTLGLGIHSPEHESSEWYAARAPPAVHETESRSPVGLVASDCSCSERVGA